MVPDDNYVQEAIVLNSNTGLPSMPSRQWEVRRRAIVGAAAQVFQEMGYERASMDAVAKRVGGSKATLYNYFSSKEELFETVVRAFSTRFFSEAVG